MESTRLNLIYFPSIPQRQNKHNAIAAETNFNRHSDRASKEAIQMRKRLKDSDIYDQLAAKGELAQDYLNVGDPKQAINAAESGMNLEAHGSDSVRRKVSLMDRLAQAYFGDHDYQKSADMLKQAAVLSRENKFDCADDLEKGEKEVASLANGARH